LGGSRHRAGTRQTSSGSRGRCDHRPDADAEPLPS